MIGEEGVRLWRVQLKGGTCTGCAGAHFVKEQGRVCYVSGLGVCCMHVHLWAAAYLSHTQDAQSVSLLLLGMVDDGWWMALCASPYFVLP